MGADEDTTTTEGGAGNAPEGRNFANLRKQNEALAAENSALAEQLLEQSARTAGFDVGVGVTQMVMREFRAAYPRVPPTPEAFAAFASEKGLRPDTGAGTGAPAAGTTATREGLTIEQQIAAAEAANDWETAGTLKTQRFLARGAGSNTGELDREQRKAELAAQIKEAEAAGDWDRAGTLKTERLLLTPRDANGHAIGSQIVATGSDQERNWQPIGQQS